MIRYVFLILFLWACSGVESSEKKGGVTVVNGSLEPTTTDSLWFSLYHKKEPEMKYSFLYKKRISINFSLEWQAKGLYSVVLENDKGETSIWNDLPYKLDTLLMVKFEKNAEVTISYDSLAYEEWSVQVENTPYISSSNTGMFVFSKIPYGEYKFIFKHKEKQNFEKTIQFLDPVKKVHWGLIAKDVKFLFPRIFSPEEFKINVYRIEERADIKHFELFSTLNISNGNDSALSLYDEGLYVFKYLDKNLKDLWVSKEYDIVADTNIDISTWKEEGGSVELKYNQGLGVNLLARWNKSHHPYFEYSENGKFNFSFIRYGKHTLDIVDAKTDSIWFQSEIEISPTQKSFVIEEGELKPL